MLEKSVLLTGERNIAKASPTSWQDNIAIRLKYSTKYSLEKYKDCYEFNSRNVRILISIIIIVPCLIFWHLPWRIYLSRANMCMEDFITHTHTHTHMFQHLPNTRFLFRNYENELVISLCALKTLCGDIEVSSFDHHIESITVS